MFECKTVCTVQFSAILAWKNVETGVGGSSPRYIKCLVLVHWDTVSGLLRKLTSLSLRAKANKKHFKLRKSKNS